jgi:hypothetical protein
VDCLRGGGRIYAGARGTVRKHRADHPKMPPELPVLHLEKRIVCALHADRPCGEDCPHSPRGPSDKHRANKSTEQNGSKRSDVRTREEHEEHSVNWLLTDRPWPPGGLSAMSGQSSPNTKTQAREQLSVHGSPKRLELLRHDLGDM